MDCIEVKHTWKRTAKKLGGMVCIVCGLLREPAVDEQDDKQPEAC